MNSEGLKKGRMSRRILLTVTALAAAGLLVTLWVVRGLPPFEGPETQFTGSGDEDEQFGWELMARLDDSRRARLFREEVSLDMTDYDLALQSPATGKETSDPVNIDGQAGKLNRGWYADGSPWYESTWLNGREHGREVSWDGRGRKIKEIHWKDGYLHGRYARWYANGQMAEESHYDRFRLHGTHRTWYRTGRESSRTSYRNGLREGEFIAWHPNGTRHCQASFREDCLDGIWRKWDTNGRLVKQIEYRKGMIASETPGKRMTPAAYHGRLGAHDFSFVLAQGSDQYGFNTLRVSAAGRCEYRYFVTSIQVHTDGDAPHGLAKSQIHRIPVCRRAEFQLTDQMQRQLRDGLGAADLFALEDRYIEKRIADGTQWIIRLRAEGEEKRIYCSNTFPEPLLNLSRTLRDRIMVPHKIELLTATRIEGKPWGQMEEEWLEDPEK